MRNPPLVCGIPFFFLFLFSKNKKADEERRREEGIPFFKRSTREKTGEKTKRKAKIREKTKNEKELRLRNIVRDAFFSSLDRSFFFPFLKKEGQRERDASTFFLFFSGKRKKENAPRMKDGIRKKGDRRKEGKKEKKEGDDLHPGKGKEKSGSTP